jgi:aryl-alcohol dehydrogenase-like predicted oxidoreductase
MSEYASFGKTELKLSRFGFGGCPLGGHDWGGVNSKEQVKAIKVSRDLGINLFDTADVYGLGESERILGEALKGDMQEAVIATKFGVRVEGGKTFNDCSPAWMEKALSASLKRLGTDRIDIYQLHYLDNVTPLEDLFEAVEKKRDQGKIGYFGLSNISAGDLKGIDIPDWVISFQNQYSLVDRDKEKQVLEIVDTFGLGFMSWGSLGQGILSGKYKIGHKFKDNDRRSREVYTNFQAEKYGKNLEIVNRLEEIAEKYGKTIGQVALRWVLDYLENSIVLVGIKTVNQLKENAGILGWSLEKEDIAFIDSITR